MREPVVVGVPSSAWAAPVARRLADDGPAMLTDVPALIARTLREGGLSAALLAPTDYARDSSAYRIIPEAAVSSAGPSGPVRLHFRSRARTITRLAADPSSSSEIILARILLAEEFDSAPQIVPHPGPLGAMLETAEAALVVGGSSWGPGEPAADSLDLIEAWQELTDLPFVYGIWCAYERALPEAEARRIQAAHREAQAETESLSVASPQNSPALFQYSGQTLQEESVQELLHYAYYHGILADVPELEYYPFGVSDRSR
jgi:chorismate dehydratase